MFIAHKQGIFVYRQTFYDGLNRMLDAVYGEGTNIGSNANRFSEKVGSYDKNGNILSLQRYGQTSVNGYGLVDDLSYTLDGNRLQRVDDVVTGSAYNGSFEFKDTVKQANEYAYDAAGNLTQDLNKNISNIQYNSLNLPRRITFTDGSSIEYTYASDGTKLRTKHIINGTTTTTDYCGNGIYENGVQKLLLTEEGYVTLSDNKYHYYLQDHQGNNRLVVDASGIVEEVNHYYPFGGVFASTSSVQPYKYNGKELDTKKGLNWYDYGARYYDAVLGRFTTVDPLAEKLFPWSPYTYCYDSPILHVDPTGKFGETVWDVFNVGLGLKSFVDNLKSGHIGAALMDAAGVVLDAGSALLPFMPGGASSAIQALRGADKVADAVQAVNKIDEVGDVSKAVPKSSGKIKIEIAPENKIDRSLLNPPLKSGNAPTLKTTGEPVDIHHIGQNPNGPFMEMIMQDHRGKGNFKKNHPYLGESSRIDRNEFKRQSENIGKKNMDSKAKQEIDELVGELLKYSSNVLEWNEPVDPGMIEFFEQKFHVILPDDYKYLLSITNGYSLLGDGILGLSKGKKYDLFDSYQFEHYEAGNPQFTYLIPFNPDGFGNFYCLDTRIVTNGGASNQIIFWCHDCEYSEATPPKIIHNSLADYIKENIQFTAELIDYEGYDR